MQGTDFITSNYDIDRILRRKYVDNVPLGYNENVFSLYQPGWGFDRNDIYRTGNPSGWGMLVSVTVNGTPVSVTSATFIPSYVTSCGSGSNVAIDGYKYISPDDFAAVILKVTNRGSSPAEICVTASTDVAVATDNVLSGVAGGLPITISGDQGFDTNGNELIRSVSLCSGETAEFRIVMSMTEISPEHFFSDEDPLATQKRRFHQWFLENIPYLDVPDEQIRQIYYFRWYTYRNHIRKTTDGYYVITEFLPNVRWAGLHNAINCPAAMHVEEGRWLKNPQYINDYLTYWLYKDSVFHYSCWLTTAYYERYLVNRDPTIFKDLNRLKEIYADWISKRYHEEMGLYYQDAGKDGMESAVGGNGYRPTINSYQYADAVTLARLCELSKDLQGKESFTRQAETIKATMNEKLWDQRDCFYKIIRKNQTEKIDARELLGYIPWMFRLPDDTVEFGTAWRYLMREDGFWSEYGPRTAEFEYAARNPVADYGGGTCRWNGPSWPFATTQTLISMANVLNDYKNQTFVDKNDYFKVLQTYAKSQYKNGAPWIAENLDADNGTWIADCDRSPNYNHSEFANLIITGLLGIRPDEGDVLTVNPMIPDDWQYFCLENVPYGGKLITLLYDKDGTHYGQGVGFRIYVDGTCRMTTETVQPSSLNLCEISD